MLLKKVFLCLAVFALTLGSCKQFINGGSQLWLFQSGRTASGNEDTTMSAANFLYLTEDGRYTRDFGSFDYGDWKVKDKKLTLTPEDKTGAVTYDLRAMNSKEMVMRLGARAMTFKIFPSDGDPEENPFSLKNNRWRIHPQARETDQQIVERLKNHFAFWEAYFTWGIKNDLQNMDVRGTPTAVKVYGNGFQLKHHDELPAGWVNSFYDSTDCKLATEKIRKVFRARNIIWNWRDGKFRMFYSAFRQMGEQVN